MAELDRQHYDYNRMVSAKCLTEFKDIKVGTTYHIPPIIIYDRRDFICEYKDWNTVRGKMIYSDGTCQNVTMYQTELSMRFLVEKQSI